MSSSLLNKCKSSQNRSSSCDFGFLTLNTPIPGRKIIYVIRPYLPYTVQRKVGKFYLDGAKNWLHHFWSVNTCSRQFAVETCWARLIRPPPHTLQKFPGGTLTRGHFALATRLRIFFSMLPSFPRYRDIISSGESMKQLVVPNTVDISIGWRRAL